MIDTHRARWNDRGASRTRPQASERWIEGRNLIVDVRGAEGQPDRLPALVAELLAGKPDIIVAVAPQPARAAKAATSVIPIVFVAVHNPIALGLVTNFARPNANVTGLTTSIAGGFMGKMLALLKEAVPMATLPRGRLAWAGSTYPASSDRRWPKCGGRKRTMPHDHSGWRSTG